MCNDACAVEGAHLRRCCRRLWCSPSVAWCFFVAFVSLDYHGSEERKVNGYGFWLRLSDTGFGLPPSIQCSQVVFALLLLWCIWFAFFFLVVLTVTTMRLRVRADGPCDVPKRPVIVAWARFSS